MNRTRICAIVGLAVLLGAPAVHAQDAAPATLGGYETQGSVTAGYRFVDVAGRQQKYQELFDLRPGFRLFEFDLFGRTASGGRFADRYNINASGLGGDPYPGGQLSISKDGVYDLRVNFRQHYYYWNRNDEQPNPGGLPGLTINHDWATVRKFGSANLTINATDHMRFTLEFNRNSREGTSFVTRALDYFNAPSAWGGFARANPYYLAAPMNEVASRVAGGLSYNWRNWNFFYRVGYQTFEQNMTLDNVVSPQRSIALGDPVTAGELLQRASFSQYRRLKTPLSEFSYVGDIRSRVQVRGGYIFYKYSGPLSQNASFNGVARITGTTLGSYSVVEDDRGHVSEPNHVVDQGATFKLTNTWNLLADYRYSRFRQDAVLDVFTLRDSVTPTPGEAETGWHYDSNRIDVALEFAPGSKILVRPGIRFMTRDVKAFDEHVLDPLRSIKSKFTAPILSVFYAPTERFTIRGNIQSITNDRPYTRISPRTDVAGRWIVRYRAGDRWTIENSAILRTGQYWAIDRCAIEKQAGDPCRNTIRSIATTVTYAFNDRLSVFGSLGYDSFFAKQAITFLRGTPPLDAVWRDQTINRVWQGGIDARPTKRVIFRFSGNYDRTTGVGEISGELPTQGPIKFPLVTGTASYDFGKPGRFSLDLQRTYYIEEIMKGDNFSANILAIRWTKDF